jgi:hypothetical protein
MSLMKEAHSLPPFRFAHLKHPSTSHITSVVEGCSHYAPSDLTYVRKSDPSFMGFQKDDIEKRQAHREKVRQSLILY